MVHFAWNPGVREFLERLGASRDVIEFIDQIEDSKVQGKLANEVRKRPGIALEEVEALAGQIKKPEGRKLNEKELAAMNEVGLLADFRDPAMKNFVEWITIQLVKNRNDENFLWIDPPPIARSVSYKDLHFELAMILDWFHATHPRIASYTFGQAARATDDWHRAMEHRDAGFEYDGSGKVVHKFANDWTIREVTSENDLKAEGNKMGHCVDSYCERVSAGKSLIYSLRDPQNEPHATIELVEGGEIKQIQGKQNNEPIAKYRKLIGAWLREIDAHFALQFLLNVFVKDCQSLRDLSRVVRKAVDIFKGTAIHEPGIGKTYGVNTRLVMSPTYRNMNGVDFTIWIFGYVENFVYDFRSTGGPGMVMQAGWKKDVDNESLKDIMVALAEVFDPNELSRYYSPGPYQPYSIDQPLFEMLAKELEKRKDRS